MYDMIVIGAGPAGSYLASLCSSQMQVLVLEEKTVPGNKACSGLVSGRIKDILPGYVIDTPGIIQHAVKGAKIHIFGHELEVRKKGTAAYVIDRDLLDKRLAEHASSMGCEIKFKTRVREISVMPDRVSVKTGKGVFESKLVAGCGGARSVAAMYIGAKPQELLNGLVLYVNVEDRSDCVEMWFGGQKARDGFCWRIPRGSQTEFGAMGKNLSFSQVGKFFGLKGGEIVKKAAAPIPIGLVRSFSTRLLLAGDSACQTKPWSGGGIIYGLLAAQVASKVIKHAVGNNEFSENFLSEYEAGWKKILLKDIQAGLMFRQLYKDLPEGEVSKLIKKLSALKSLENKTDFDFPFSSLLNEIGGVGDVLGT